MKSKILLVAFFLGLLFFPQLAMAQDVMPSSSEGVAKLVQLYQASKTLVIPFMAIMFVISLVSVLIFKKYEAVIVCGIVALLYFAGMSVLGYLTRGGG